VQRVEGAAMGALELGVRGKEGHLWRRLARGDEVLYVANLGPAAFRCRWWLSVLHGDRSLSRGAVDGWLVGGIAWLVITW
jgi:hypothetical protein